MWPSTGRPGRQKSPGPDKGNSLGGGGVIPYSENAGDTARPLGGGGVASERRRCGLREEEALTCAERICIVKSGIKILFSILSDRQSAGSEGGGMHTHLGPFHWAILSMCHGTSEGISRAGARWRRDNPLTGEREPWPRLRESLSPLVYEPPLRACGVVSIYFCLRDSTNDRDAAARPGRAASVQPAAKRHLEVSVPPRRVYQNTAAQTIIKENGISAASNIP